MLAAALVLLFWVIARQALRQDEHNVALSTTADALRTSGHIGNRRWELNDIGRTPEQREKHRQDTPAHRPFRDCRYDRIGLDGFTRHVSVSGVPTYVQYGSFTGYRGTGRDITAQIQADQDLQQAKDRVELASRHPIPRRGRSPPDPRKTVRADRGDGPRSPPPPAVPPPGVPPTAQRRELTIWRYASSGNAFIDRVRMFPSWPSNRI